MKKIQTYKQLYNLSKLYRKKLLKISQSVSALHVGGSFSCFEILNTIFNIFMRKNKVNFILSKGHAGIALYIVLNNMKIISNKDISMYCKKNGKLGVHPEIKTAGVLASTGSLGHGLGISSGIAIKEPNKICFVVMSDGELMEGSVWENALIISSLNLRNIVVIVDFNGLQSATFNKNTHKTLTPIKKKFISFGWASDYCNGHSIIELEKKIKNRPKNKPYALIAKTIKGYPVSFMMNKPIWHYRSPNKEEFLKALKEINEK